jgi:hypothetical protein
MRTEPFSKNRGENSKAKPPETVLHSKATPLQVMPPKGKEKAKDPKSKNREKENTKNCKKDCDESREIFREAAPDTLTVTPCLDFCSFFLCSTGLLHQWSNRQSHLQIQPIDEPRKAQDCK